MAILFYAADSITPPPTAPWTDTFENLDNWIDENTGAATTIINSNKVRHTANGTDFTRNTLIYTVDGDFSVQIDFDGITFPATHGWFFQFRLALVSDSTTSMNVSRAYHTGLGGHKMYAIAYLSGAGQGGTLDNPTDSGRLRIIRAGSDWTASYYDGSWHNLQTKTLGTGPADIKLYNIYSGATPPLRVVDYDNFTINSGTIIAP